jgi:hypothetical protein
MAVEISRFGSGARMIWAANKIESESRPSSVSRLKWRQRVSYVGSPRCPLP